MSGLAPPVPAVPPTRSVASPYPGLRPFDRKEVRIFFGRRRHKNEMLSLLRKVRFLGVVGTSGCGKSSLVKAGLIPELSAGWMLSSDVPWADGDRYPDWVSSRWFIAEMRPGAHPFRGLASALLDSGVLGSSWTRSAPESLPALAARLQVGPGQLIQQWERATGSPNGNLLILVDQFEELFRFRDGDNLGLAQTFVRSLIQLAKQTDWPIYIVITMRSDFLGECSQFADLPEFLNQGQYLVPRLTTSEIQEAIECPARMFGAAFDELLVTRLLNDISNDSDQLPLLQHALKRMWELSATKRREHDQASPGAPCLLRVEDYDRPEIGGVTKALDLHAEELFQSLSGTSPDDFRQLATGDSGDRRIARILFQALTVREKGRETRRPTRLSLIAQVAGVEESDVVRVANVFRHPAVSIIAPLLDPDRPLTSDTKLDVVHESILRKWERLRCWIDSEARWAQQYRRLRDEVENAARFIFDTHLDNAVEWKKTCQPNVHWALRYEAPDCPPAVFDEAFALIDRSVEERKRLVEEKRQQERDRITAQEAKSRSRLLVKLLSVVAGVAAVAIGAGIYAHQQRSNVLAANNKLEEVNQYLEDSRREAESSALTAHKESSRAFSQVANDARKSGDWIRATHNYLNAARSMSRAKESPEAQRNVALASQLASGNIIQTAPGFGSKTLANPGSSLMLAWDDGPRLSIWDLNRAERVCLFDHGAPIAGVGLSEDESKVLLWSSQGAGRVTVWALPRRGAVASETAQKPFMQVEHAAPLNGASFNPIGTRILTWGVDGNAKLWPVASSTSSGAMDAPAEQTSGTLPHGAPIVGAQFSNDGSRVLTVAGQTTKVWNAISNEPIQSLTHKADVAGALFSPNGTRVLTWARDKQAWLWEIDRSQAIRTFVHGGPGQGSRLNDGSINGAMFLDNSSMMTWSADGKVRFWDPANDEPVKTLDHLQPVIGAQLTHDQGRLLIWGGNGACFWDLADNARLINTWRHDGSVLSAQLGSKETQILTWSTDNAVRVWDAGKDSGSSPLQTLGHDSLIRGARFTNDDSQVLVWCADRSLKRWYVTDPRLLYSFPELSGKSPVLGARLNETQTVLLLWRFNSLKEGNEVMAFGVAEDRFTLLPQMAKNVQGAIFSRDGSRCLAWSYKGGGAAGIVTDWDLQRLTIVRQADAPLEQVSIVGANWSEDGTRLITWGDDDVATLWDEKDATVRQRFFRHEPASDRTRRGPSLNGATMSGDGRTVLTWGNDRTARHWDAESGKKLRRFDHPSPVRGASFSPDGRKILTWADRASNQETRSFVQSANQANMPGSGASDVRLWSTDGDKELLKVHHERAVNGASLNKAGDRLLTWSDDGTAVLWDSSNGNRLQTFQRKDAVLGARFLRDGSLVLTWSRDKTAALWDVSRSLPLAEFKHDDSVTGALTNHNDTRLLTWSADKTAKWWDISLHDERLTPDDRILEFVVRTATELSDTGEVVPLSETEWNDKAKEWREKSDKLAHQKPSSP